MKIKYTLPKDIDFDESTGRNELHKSIVSYDEEYATTELLAEEVKKLEAMGYEVTVEIKLKVPKD